VHHEGVPSAKAIPAQAAAAIVVRQRMAVDRARHSGHRDRFDRLGGIPQNEGSHL